jgi:hypothetical protein
MAGGEAVFSKLGKICFGLQIRRKKVKLKIKKVFVGEGGRGGLLQKLHAPCFVLFEMLFFMYIGCCVL